MFGCVTLITDSRGIFNDAINHIKPQNESLAREVAVLADQYQRMEQTLSDLAEEDRLKVQQAQFVHLKPALVVIQGGLA